MTKIKQKNLRKWQLHTFAITFNELLLVKYGLGKKMEVLDYYIKKRTANMIVSPRWRGIGSH